MIIERNEVASAPRRLLFTISLLQTNHSRKGTRYRVGSSPFVIGRSESCALSMSSRSVSRKHCVILFNDSEVLVRDLDSRNGTQVSGEAIPPEIPRQLAHHDELRIGKYSFRVSIRDATTRRPYRPQLIDQSTLSGPTVVPADQTKGAEQLLSELDDLATRLEVRRDGEAELLRSATMTETAEDPTKESDSGKDKSVDTKQSSPSPKPEAPEQPQGIPEHLRPKQPKDSQAAAAKALKNLFVR